MLQHSMRTHYAVLTAVIHAHRSIILRMIAPFVEQGRPQNRPNKKEQISQVKYVSYTSRVSASRAESAEESTSASDAEGQMGLRAVPNAANRNLQPVRYLAKNYWQLMLPPILIISQLTIHHLRISFTLYQSNCIRLNPEF